MDFTQVKANQKIKYIGDSFAFGGEYTLIHIEETFQDRTLCPIKDRGKLVIIEFMNDDTPMFFTLDQLDPNEWEVVI